MPVLRRTPTLRALELNLTTPSTSHPQRERNLPTSALAMLRHQVDFAALSRLALLNMVIDGETLWSILAAAPALEELYICAAWADVRDCPGLSDARLRVFHANTPENAGPSAAQLTGVAARMPRVVQVGSGNRVYEVHRWYEGEERRVELSRWSQIQTPGYFQVWRP